MRSGAQVRGELPAPSIPGIFDFFIQIVKKQFRRGEQSLAR
jgi:hypothetical protein